MNRQISFGSTTLNVVERGSGETALVFLHFYGGAGRTWTEVIDRLEGEFRCVAPDLRGFGASTPATDGDYSVDANAADIVSLIEDLGLTRYLLVGHSMGGKLALAVAAQRAGNGRPIAKPLAHILLAPSPPTPEPMSDEDRESSRKAQGDPEAAQKTLEKIAADPIPPAIARRTIDDIVRTSRAAWLAWLDGGSKEDISDRMAAITAPVYVLSGSRDLVVPTDVLQHELIARIAGSRLTVVSGAGHLLPLEAPEEVAGCIRKAVDQLLGARSDD